MLWQKNGVTREDKIKNGNLYKQYYTSSFNNGKNARRFAYVLRRKETETGTVRIVKDLYIEENQNRGDYI